MKQKKIFIVLCIMYAQQTCSSWLTSGQLPTKNKALLQQNPNATLTISSYPLLGLNPTDGTIQQVVQNRSIKASLPSAIVPALKHASFSILRPNQSAFKNYPKGDALFKNHPTLATKFDALIQTLTKSPNFIPFFRKVHLNILNELYEYLMRIYTNFNLQHSGITNVKISATKEEMKVSIPSFLHNERVYEQNKKTLIINHFINVIESQFNGAIRSIMPKVPHLFATYSGKTLIQNDYSIDLTHFMVKQIDTDIQEYQKEYLQGLAQYLSFFEEYTSYMLQPSTNQDSPYTAFVDIAESINDFLYSDISSNETSSAKMQHVVTKMDPPIFNFNYDDLRALKLIPHLAKSLPSSTSSVPWPSHIVKAADQGLLVEGHPIAYFTNKDGAVVREAEGIKLYMVTQSGKNSFQEELLQQPDWLNSWTGVATILQACFGNFSKLIGLNILDSCTEALLQNAIDISEGKEITSSDSAASICQERINSWSQPAKPITSTATSSTNNLIPPTSNATSSSSLSGMSPSSSSISSNSLSGMSPSSNDISSSSGSGLSGLNPSSADISST